jgi:glycosyltransferase involved in cell wall biosynthesis
MNEPLVSVIIPFYNSSNTIAKSINSVFIQTYNNIEIILVDDGSTDDSLKKVRKILKNNNKYPYKILKQENQGPSKARNKAIKVSRGKYIAFLDADDKWKSKKTKIQIDYLEDIKDLKMIGSLTNYNKDRFYKDNFKYINFKDMLFRNYFNTPSVILEKAILRDIGMFDEKLSFSEDWDLWMRISYEYDIGKVNKFLVECGGGKFPYGERGLSSNLRGMLEGSLKGHKKIFLNKMYSENYLINLVSYYFFYAFNFLKHYRRFLIIFKNKIFKRK